MKKFIILSIPVMVSFLGLEIFCHTLNPIIIRGPEFLKFYASLMIGFYLSLFCLRFLGENVSRVCIYFMIFIFILGVVKLFRGLSLDRPVGILFSILAAEILINMIFISIDFKQKMKK